MTSLRAPLFYRFLAPVLLLLVAVGAVAQVPKTLLVVPKTGPLAGKVGYARLHALLIGVSEYQNLPRNKWLEFATRDATELRDMLVQHYGFRAGDVRVLLNEQATRANIEAALNEFADNRKIGPEDGVLVYFSGHGQTVKLAIGGETGFLIPYDARIDLAATDNPAPYLNTCLKMDQIWSPLEASPAKHALLLTDACFSGLLAQSRDLDDEKLNPQALAELSTQPARQVITAGRKGQEAFEDPKLGHGAFTYKLLEHLKAKAANPDQVFLAAELHGRLLRSVSNLTEGKQTPVIGNYRGTEGQFLFVVTAPLAGSPVGRDESKSSTEAKLRVVSTPPGAAITLDGEPTGKVTPALITLNLGLAASRQVEIGLKLAGQKPATQAVTAVRGEARTVTVTLQADLPAGPSPGGHRAGETWVNPVDGAVLVYVPAGEFRMGNDDGLVDEGPVHAVKLTRGYWLYQTEVTNETYGQFLAANPVREKPYYWTDPRFNAPQQPVVGVDWEDAVAYSRWAGGRLPSEAEWEYAAGGPQGRKYPWGDQEPDATRAVFVQDIEKGRPGLVGQLPAGASWCGALDLAGNVWEWCADWYDPHYYQQSPAVDPRGATSGFTRLVRGGSWSDSLAFLRVALRRKLAPIDRADNLGFRPVRTE